MYKILFLVLIFHLNSLFFSPFVCCSQVEPVVIEATPEYFRDQAEQLLVKTRKLVGELRENSKQDGEFPEFFKAVQWSPKEDPMSCSSCCLGSKTMTCENFCIFWGLLWPCSSVYTCYSSIKSRWSMISLKKQLPRIVSFHIKGNLERKCRLEVVELIEDFKKKLSQCLHNRIQGHNQQRESGESPLMDSQEIAKQKYCLEIANCFSAEEIAEIIYLYLRFAGCSKPSKRVQLGAWSDLIRGFIEPRDQFQEVLQQLEELRNLILLKQSGVSPQDQCFLETQNPMSAFKSGFYAYPTIFDSIWSGIMKRRLECELEHAKKRKAEDAGEKATVHIGSDNRRHIS